LQKGRRRVSEKAVEVLSESRDWASWGSWYGGDRYANAFARVVRFGRGKGEDKTISRERGSDERE
jgi:hypothetical protein